jgi:hypothetical protein
VGEYTSSLPYGDPAPGAFITPLLRHLGNIALHADPIGAFAHGMGINHACIFSSVSMFIPSAFSIRSAISGESAALPFTKSDKVARRTPSTPAARDTDK